MSDMDAAFEALMEGVDLTPPQEVIDVAGLSDQELGSLRQRTVDELAKLGELHSPNPKIERSRELHALRAAIVIETNQRAYDRDQR